MWFTCRGETLRFLRLAASGAAVADGPPSSSSPPALPPTPPDICAPVPPSASSAAQRPSTRPRKTFAAVPAPLPRLTCHLAIAYKIIAHSDSPSPPGKAPRQVTPSLPLSPSLFLPALSPPPSLFKLLSKCACLRAHACVCLSPKLSPFCLPHTTHTRDTLTCS